MSGRSGGRHRRQSSQLTVKIGVVAAGTAVAGTVVAGVALIGDVPATPPSVGALSQDVALTAGATDTFDLKGLLDAIMINGPTPPGGTVPLGTSTLDNVLLYGFPDLGNLTLGQLLGDLGLSHGMATTVTQLLDAANLGSLEPINTLLAPLGLTGTSDLKDILTNIDAPGTTSPLGDVTLDSLLATIALPGGGHLSDATTLSTLLTDFPSLANIQLPPIPFLGGILGTPSLGELVNLLGLGGTTLGALGNFGPTTDLFDLATSLGIGTTSINSVLADLGTHDGITLTSTSNLDDFANFLGFGGDSLSQLIPGDLTDSSTLVNLLDVSAIFGNIGQETIDELLGLSTAASSSAAVDAFAALLG